MKRILALVVFALTATFAAYAQSAQSAMVYVSLSSSLDATTVKAGDPLTATLCDKAKFPDGSVMPKGTVLTGHVISTNGNSVSVVLDQAQVGDKSQPVHVAIRTLYDSSTYDDESYNSSDIKATGAPFSKLRGIELSSTDGNSGTLTAQKSKRLWLDNHTLFGVILTKA